MNDQTFADLVRHAEGDVPTAAELGRMRARLIEALDAPDGTGPDLGLLPPLEPDHGGTTMPSRPIIGVMVAAAAAALLIVGIALFVGGSDGDDEIVETTTPTPAPTETPVEEPTASPTATPTPTPAVVDEDVQSAPPGTDPLEDIDAVPVRLEPGAYWVDSLGTEMVLDVGEQWTAHRHTAGRVVLGDAFTNGPGDNDLLFMRATELADPTRPTRVGADWFYRPAGDIDAWIDAVVPGIEITGVRATDVGGYPATTFDVVIDPEQLDCISMGCIRFATNGSTFALLGLADSYRIWYVEQGVHEPLVIVASVSRSNDVWLAAVDEIVAAVELGEARPMPPAG